MLTLILWAAMLPPRLPELKNYGCNVVEVPVKDASYSWWKVLVWATYDSGNPWTAWESEHEGNAKGRSESLRDCDKWMQSVDQALRRRG